MKEDASLLQLLAIESLGTPEQEIPTIPNQSEIDVEDYPYG